MATASREIAMVSNQLEENGEIVPFGIEVQRYLNELSGEQDPTEIILLLCAAGDFLDNILEKPVEEDKEEKSRHLIDVALKKLEECEPNLQMENRAPITRFKIMFMEFKRDFEKRFGEI